MTLCVDQWPLSLFFGRSLYKSNGISYGSAVKNRSRFSYFIELTLLFSIYFATAKLGLSIAAVNRFATLVWAPTGIALAALLLFGYRLWPGILLGAYLVNFMIGAPVPVALGIGIGNTLEAVLGAYFLRRTGFLNSMDRMQDVLKIIVFAAILSTLLSSFIGVTSLWLGAVIPVSAYRDTWAAWWFGDMMGDLIVAPLLLVWGTRHFEKMRSRQVIEVTLLIFFTVLICEDSFFDLPYVRLIKLHHAYFIFPILLWAAARFRLHGAVTTVFFLSTMSILSTIHGRGPFVTESISESLSYLQPFLVVVALTGLVLAAAVNESKQEKDRLEKAKAHLSSILEASLNCVISMDHLGRILEFNPAAEKTFGYRRDEVIGKDMAPLIIPPSLRGAHHRGLQHYLSVGEGPVLGKRIEMSAIRGDGSEFPVELFIHRLNMAGPPIFTGFLRDITEIKRREEERTQLIASEQAASRRSSAQYEIMNVLAESETFDEAVQSILKIICFNLGWDLGTIWLVDDAKQVLNVIGLWHSSEVQVPDFIQMTFQTKFSIGKGLPGRIWSSQGPAWIEDVTHDPNFPRFKIAEQEGLHGAFGFPILSGKKVLGIVEFFSRSIRSPDPDLMKTVTSLGGQIGLYMERKKAEDALRTYRDELELRVEERTAALRKSEERYRLMVGNIRGYAIISLDLEGFITSWNEGAERLKGYTADEVIGKHFSLFYSNEDIEAGKPGSTLKTLIAENRFEDVSWRIRKNGSRFWANIVISPIKDATGKIIGFVNITRDLTEQKRIQELEETIHMRDEFLSIASHELKTPLTSLYLHQQVLRKRLEKKDNLPIVVDTQMTSGIKKAEEASKRLVHLLDDLLDISRIRVGILKIDKQDTDLVQIIQRVIESFSPEMKRSGITLSFFTNVPSIIGLWDPVRIEQVITNLVSNALKYGEQKPIEIDLKMNQETKSLRLIVKDQGMGISRELIPKIFQRFERAVPSGKIGGLGLGLYIVQQIIQAHGGYVYVESELGKGSTFIVQLPVEEMSVTQEKTAHA